MIPHFAVPFRFKSVGGAVQAVVNDQDSYEELYDSVQTITRYTRGSRPALPDFGVSDQTFSSPSIDAEKLREEIIEWEPRVDPRSKLSVDGLVETVVIDVFSRSGS